MAGIEKIAGDEGLQVLGWREVPVDNSMIGQQAADVEPSFRQLFLAAAEGQPPLSGIDLDRRCFMVRKRIEHELETGGEPVYFPSLSARTLVYKGMLISYQVGELLPRPRRRAGRVGPRPRAQPLLHQHVPVVAAGPPVPLRRPQRRDQHGDGQRELDAGPRGAARDRRSSPASSGPSRSARPAAPTPPASTRSLELLHLGGYSLPHAVLMMIPEAWEHHESMPDWKRDFYRFHASRDGAVGRPGVDRLHRRHRDRRRARPQRPAPVAATGSPTTASSSWRRRSACCRSTRPRSCRRAASSRAACSSSTPTSAASSATTRSRRRSPPSSPTASGSTPGSCTSTTCPARDFLTPQHASVVKHQRVFGYTTEELKILLGADGPHRRRADRLDGHRHARRRAVRPARACCSTTSSSCSPRSPTRRSTPSARSWSRRWASTIGPEGNLLAPGPGVVPPGRAPPPDPHQRRAGQAPLHQRRRRHARASSPSPSTASTRVAEGGEGLRRALEEVRAKVQRRHRRRRQAHRAVRPLLVRRAGADPVAAAHRRRCTTTSSARRPAPRSASSSSAATPARCTTWRCSSATAPPPSTRTSPSRRSRT